MIQAVILDFDGLMVYSEDVCLDAWQRTLAPYGKTMSDETYRSLIGTSQKHSIDHVIALMGVDAAHEDLDRALLGRARRPQRPGRSPDAWRARARRPPAEPRPSSWASPPTA